MTSTMSPPALPTDLARAGWAWESSPERSVVRLAIPAEGLATAWTTPAEAVGAILEARRRQDQEAAIVAQEPARVVVAFDYQALPAEARVVVQQATKEIRDEYELMQRSAMKIGRRLADAKAALPHGSWGAWLESEFGWSQQTATNYMRQAQLAAQNPKFLEFEQQIDPSARTLLADPSTPEPARQEALGRAEAGERVRHRDAREIVGAAKAATAVPADPRAAVETAMRRGDTTAAYAAARGASDHHSRAMAAVDALVDRRPLDDALALLWAPTSPAPRQAATAKGVPPMAPAPEPAAPAAPAETLDGQGRQPYGAKGAGRWQPLARHVLIIEQRTHRYGPPPLTRAATIYDTPTTIRVRRPDGKEETQAQHKVWAVPTDQAWSEIEAARDAFGQALSAFADVLRDLGRYDTRLRENGGIKQVPAGPLCPSVARADDPDASNQSSWWLSPWHVPRLERTTIARHTAKMLASADIGSYLFAQAESWCLADDLAWERISAAHQACKDAATAVSELLRRLGTYDEALRRGGRPAAASPAIIRAPVVEAPPPAEEAEDQAGSAAAQGASDQARYDRAEVAARALAAALPDRTLRIIYAALAEVDDDGGPDDDAVRSFVAEALADSVLALEPGAVAWVLGEAAQDG